MKTNIFSEHEIQLVKKALVFELKRIDSLLKMHKENQNKAEKKQHIELTKQQIDGRLFEKQVILNLIENLNINYNFKLLEISFICNGLKVMEQNLCTINIDEVSETEADKLISELQQVRDIKGKILPINSNLIKKRNEIRRKTNKNSTIQEKIEALMVSIENI